MEGMGQLNTEDPRDINRSSLSLGPRLFSELEHLRRGLERRGGLFEDVKEDRGSWVKRILETGQSLAFGRGYSELEL
jgi:hypothetical protein